MSSITVLCIKTAVCTFDNTNYLTEGSFYELEINKVVYTFSWSPLNKHPMNSHSACWFEINDVRGNPEDFYITLGEWRENQINSVIN